MSQISAEHFHDSLPEGSIERVCIMEFINNARGYENPMSKSEWCNRIRELGHDVSIGFLMRRIINPAREIYDFIGVRRYRGLYLMITREDIEKSAEFYHAQGDSMNLRGDQLIARIPFMIDLNSIIDFATTPQQPS